ncbi:MAG: acyl-CoA thioesterase, partial [Eubacterium sp.]|nr:acyl-CoA thioesterase [Eubacterium sp.]
MIYKHKVNYYETDRMGITHHSNYIRWMEEARVFYLAEVGWDYDRLEELGVVSPVLSVSAQYIKTTTFPDDITIDV